jgi:hypothetical protein
MAISPKPLVVIFFRAPGGRGFSKKPFEPTQSPTNLYMGWATPPTGDLLFVLWPRHHRPSFPWCVQPRASRRQVRARRAGTGRSCTSWINTWWLTSRWDFFIYLIYHDFAKIYMVRHKFSKNIHLASWHTASGTNAVGRGAMCRQEWAPSVAQT